MDELKEGKRVFDIEIDALQKTRDALDETFVKILNLIMECKGKVIVTGIGKPGHIARKMAATFSSLGTSAFYLHPAEAMHGDLGMISQEDLVLAISYSGESDEILKIIPNIKMIGATLVAITGNAESTLAKHSDVVQVLPEFQEACYLGLAPTSSTTSVLCYGDALAVVASGIYGFENDDFGKYHPAGALGKKLLIRVSDLMSSAQDVGSVTCGALLKDVLPQMGKMRGILCVVEGTELKGVFTDGDLRRALSKHEDIYSKTVDSVMTKTPITVPPSTLAVSALKLMKDNDIAAIPVIEDDQYLGIIHIKDITGQGIVL